MSLVALIQETVSAHPIIFLLLGAVFLVFIYGKIKDAKLPKNIPPYDKGLIPYLGVAIPFGRNPIPYIEAKKKEHGGVFTLQVLGQRLTFLVSAEAHIPFFKKGDEELDQQEPYQFSVPIFGPNVVYGCDVNLRSQQMKFMRGSLKTDKMREYVHDIVRETEMFFEQRWKDKGEVDLRQELAELIILTASRCLMGREIRERLFTEVARLFQALDEGLTTLSMFWPYAPIPAHKKRDQARIEMSKLFGKIMQERKANPEEEHKDVLQVFMDARYTDGRQLTEEEVAGLMIALLFAGQHTSSVTGSWTGLHLLNNPEFLEPVLEEQKRVLDAHGGELDYDALQDMDCLHRSIKEALRMNPPLIFLMRKTLVDMEVAGYHVPKGDTLFLSPTLSGRLEEVFANPNKFDPDRFAAPREEDKKLPYGFVGFGGGRHGCMGETFAYLQIKTIWSYLFRHYRLEMVGKMPEPDYSALVVGPTQPCTIRYERIH